MREQAGARTGGFEPESSEMASLRRQLEGGLEVLEACSARYRELSEALQRGGWKARLRESPALLRNALHAESTLPELLTRLQRRAEQEPERQGPANRWLREIEEQRTALSRHVSRRLSSKTESPLAPRLEQLQAVALKPLPLPPGEGEILLLEGGARWPPFLHFALVFVSWKLAAPFVGNWVAVPLFLAVYAWFYFRTGHYWLTTERLLWKPRLGEPVEVPLSSVGDGQVSVGLTRTVTVRGRSRVRLRYVSNARRLAALISIHRRQEFRGLTRRATPPLMALLDMYRAPPGEVPDPERFQRGLGVLRPGFVVYIPPWGGSKLLDAITEPLGPTHTPMWRSRDAVDVPDSLLLEQLQLLPEERIDTLLRKALRANLDIVLWEPSELKWTAGASSWLELVRDDEGLWGVVPSWADHQRVGRVTQSWRSE